jgi:hypothetical protein
MALLPLTTFTGKVCRQMLSNLTECLNNPPEEASKVLVISPGIQEADKEMSLTFPITLDQQLLVGRAFGTSGTPSAVLVEILLGQPMSSLYERLSRQAAVAKDSGSGKAFRVADDDTTHQLI